MNLAVELAKDHFWFLGRRRLSIHAVLHKLLAWDFQGVQLSFAHLV